MNPNDYQLAGGSGLQQAQNYAARPPAQGNYGLAQPQAQGWATQGPPQVFQRQAPGLDLTRYQPSPQMQQTPRPYPGIPGGDNLQSRQAYYDQSVRPQYQAQQAGMRPGMGGGPPPWAQQQHQAPPWMGQSMGWGGGQGYGQGMPQRQGMGYAQLGQMMQPQQRPPMGGGYGQGGFPQMDPRMAMRG